jgi:hypothetical protein
MKLIGQSTNIGSVKIKPFESQHLRSCRIFLFSMSSSESYSGSSESTAHRAHKHHIKGRQLKNYKSSKPGEGPKRISAKGHQKRHEKKSRDKAKKKERDRILRKEAKAADREDSASDSESGSEGSTSAEDDSSSSEEMYRDFQARHIFAMLKKQYHGFSGCLTNFQISPQRLSDWLSEDPGLPDQFKDGAEITRGEESLKRALMALQLSAHRSIKGMRHMASDPIESFYRLRESLSLQLHSLTLLHTHMVGKSVGISEDRRHMISLKQHMSKEAADYVDDAFFREGGGSRELSAKPATPAPATPVPIPVPIPVAIPATPDATATQPPVTTPVQTPGPLPRVQQESLAVTLPPPGRLSPSRYGLPPPRYKGPPPSPRGRPSGSNRTPMGSRRQSSGPSYRRSRR